MDKRAVLMALEAGEISLDEARAALARILGHERPTAAAVPRPSTPPARPRPAETDIAVIGMSGRFPGAEDVDALWDCLAAGLTSVTRAPLDRGWDVRDYFDPVPQTPGKTYVDKGAYLEGIDRFDPLFFGISPREAALMDPAARLFLQEAWRAVEDAGYAPNRIDGQRWGVFAAVKGDYEMYVQREHDTSFVGTEAFSAARLSYLLNLVGPALSVDTACSSGLVVVALACDSLALGNCDVAVAGGASVYSTPATLVSSSQSLLFSPDARCYAFDDRANGTVLGEAVAALVLKPLRQAERDRDAILGVIKGWGTNQDGRTNGITAPSMRSQASLQTSVYRRFGIDPERITLVEAHGTGTKLGDPIEVEALTRSFRQFTAKTAFCALGSIKPNVGHTFFASGTVGVVKALLCLRQGRIPPSVNFASPNRNLALEESPFYVNTQLEDWRAAEGERRCAAVSSFGLAGTNAHVVIEEYPRPAAEAAPDAEALVVPLSARDPQRLHEYVERLLRALARAGSSEDLRAIACTLQTGRVALDERVAVVARSRAELIETLEAFVGGRGAAAAFHGRRERAGSADPALRDRVEQALAARDAPSLARAWTQGAEVDWARLWERGRPRSARLPTYPFAREHCWLPTRGFHDRPRAGDEPGAGPAAAVDLAAIESSSSKKWLCFVEPWGTPRPERPAADWQEIGRRPSAARVAVIGGEPALEAAIRGALTAAFAGASLPAPNVERLDPAASDGLDGCVRRHQAPHAVYLFAGQADPHARLAWLLACCQALTRHWTAQPLDAFVCLDGAGEPAEAHDEALSGLLRSAMAENPVHRYHWIRHAPGAAQSGFDLACEWLSAYSRPRAGHTHALVQYRDGLRLTTTFGETQAIPLAGPPRRFRPDGAYLVTGGLGLVARRLCLEIARRYRPTLVLASRRARDAEVERTLAELNATGARALWISADVTDQAGLSGALAAIRSEVPRLHGVLHLARAVDDGLLVHKTPEGFLRAAAAKVAGAQVVDLVTRDEPLEFFVMFSSMAAFGLRGGSDYAYACAFQNAFARQRNRWRDRGQRRGDALALCWGQWEVDQHVGGERLRQLQELGFDLIDAASALRVMEACLGSPAGALGFMAVRDKERARRALVERAVPGANGRMRPVMAPERPPAADGRLRALRQALERLPRQDLLDLHAAALSRAAGTE